MDNEDMSEIIQKISGMMNNSNNNPNTNNENDISSNSNNINPDNIKNILNTLNSESSTSNNSNDNNNINFDINTILRMKNVMDKINSSGNDPRANLLLSLKPYLNNNRRHKLDEYMQFLNISRIIEAFNSDNGADKK